MVATLKTASSNSETPNTKQLLALRSVPEDGGYDLDGSFEYVASLGTETVIPSRRHRDDVPRGIPIGQQD